MVFSHLDDLDVPQCRLHVGSEPLTTTTFQMIERSFLAKGPLVENAHGERGREYTDRVTMEQVE